MKNQDVDIDKRSLDFGVRIIKLVKVLPKDAAGYALGNQIIRSGTSIGANIEEAIGASTKKEFNHSMNIAKKEARETLFWLKSIYESDILDKDRMRPIMNECEELIKILTAIVKKGQQNSK